MTKKFEFINSESQSGLYYLVIYPGIRSLTQAIDSFNRENNVNYNGKVRSDLICLTGDRIGRFIEGDIVNGKIESSSFNVSSQDNDLVKLINKIYMELPEGELNKIYPIAFRNQLKEKVKCQ